MVSVAAEIVAVRHQLAIAGVLATAAAGETHFIVHSSRITILFWDTEFSRVSFSSELHKYQASTGKVVI